MRQRKVKKRSSYLELCADYIYSGHPELRENIAGYRIPEGTDRLDADIKLDETPYEKQAFRERNNIPGDLPVYLEIGSGKGRFITQKALLNPDKYFLACEGGLNINVRILQKAQELGLNNIKVITDYITVPTDWFPEGSLDGIYLNFSDPWPKDRHAQRRLTYRKKLEGYKAIAKPGATLEFKTDNDGLFEWSLGEFEAAGMETLAITRDLWNSEFAAENIRTEYEEKFGESGKSINYIKLRLKL